LITGGSYRVWGPARSFIAGNNEIGLALIMTLPLIFFVRSIVQSRLASVALLVGAFLCFAAILGTHSRGALVGLMAMGILLGLRSPNRAQYFMVALVAIPFVFMFMPEAWWDRMESIKDYQSDASALGRINAWWMALNLASHNPLLGGGLAAFTRYNFMLYAPEPDRVNDAHSIYFEVLGEQGFIGLAIFLAIGIATLATGRKIRKQTRKIQELRWAYNLATMTQLSVLGYAVSGLFLGLAYFDFYYMLVALMVGTALVVDKQLRERPDGAAPIGAALGRGRPATIGQANGLSKSHESNSDSWSWRLRDLWSFVKTWYHKL
jgi:probable O-glycosylation ligase (exosortase A-associated)